MYRITTYEPPSPLETPTTGDGPRRGPVPLHTMGHLGMQLQIAALSLEPEFTTRRQVSSPGVVSLDPTTSSEEDDDDFTVYGHLSEQPRLHPISLATEPPTYYQATYKCPGGWLAHTRLMGQLADPRIEPRLRKPPLDPGDDWDSCFVFGAHHLPRAWDAQRHILWSMVRLPTLAQLPEEDYAVETLGLNLAAEQDNGDDIVLCVGIFIEHMMRQARATQTERGRAITELPNSRLWQELCELYMQLDHEDAVLGHIVALVEAEQTVLPLVKDAYGLPFWRVIMQRKADAEFLSLDAAVLLGAKVKEDADRLFAAGEWADAAILYIKTLAHVLPWFPSQWLMRPWEARACRLAPLWAKSYLNIGLCLLKLGCGDAAAGIFNMVYTIPGATNWEYGKAQWLTAQCYATVDVSRGLDSLSLAEQHLGRAKKYTSRPGGRPGDSAPFGTMSPEDFCTHFAARREQIKGDGPRSEPRSEPFYIRQSTVPAVRTRWWHIDMTDRVRVWTDERGMEDDDELAAENAGRMVERIHIGPAGY